MADFNTHVFTATVAASLGATVCSKVLELPVSTALLLIVAGAIGGVLPDIDLKYSLPSKILFSIWGAIAALAWVFARLNNYTVLELWVVAIAIFLAIRFPVWALFHQFTVHRGSLHSIAAAIMFAMLAAIVGDKVLHQTSMVCWLLASFVLIGVLIHLILDEVYSVDFMGVRVKRSFGSALKLLDTQRLAATCLILFVSMVAWFFTPDTTGLFAQWSALDIHWRSLLLPTYLQAQP